MPAGALPKSSWTSGASSPNKEHPWKSVSLRDPLRRWSRGFWCATNGFSRKILHKTLNFRATIDAAGGVGDDFLGNMLISFHETSVSSVPPVDSIKRCSNSRNEIDPAVRASFSREKLHSEYWNVDPLVSGISRVDRDHGSYRISSMRVHFLW